jgi:hypothetical protein
MNGRFVLLFFRLEGSGVLVSLRCAFSGTNINEDKGFIKEVKACYELDKLFRQEVSAVLERN